MVTSRYTASCVPSPVNDIAWLLPAFGSSFVCSQGCVNITRIWVLYAVKAAWLSFSFINIATSLMNKTTLRKKRQASAGQLTPAICNNVCHPVGGLVSKLITVNDLPRLTYVGLSSIECSVTTRGQHNLTQAASSPQSQMQAVRRIALEKACNREMTFKVIQGH